MGCVAEACNKGSISFSKEYDSNSGKYNEESLSYSFIKEPQYDQISKEFYDILNEIRINPENFIEESKSHNLFEIFIKLKPCSEIKYYNNDLSQIKKYLMKSYLKKKNISEQEKEIKNVINENIEEICLFQTICFNNDMKENVWDFLEGNEDDLEKIFDNKYNSLIIVSIPLEHKTKTLLTLIFYKE